MRHSTRRGKKGPQRPGIPEKQGLYDPQYAHDSCGIGFVVNVKGEKSHGIVRDAVTVLTNLTHRGARGAEANTGDGAGILVQIPHTFLQKKVARRGFTLPAPGEYGVGVVYLPPDPTYRRAIEIHFEQIIASEGQRVLGWRSVPVNNAALGETAKRAEPKMRLIFIARIRAQAVRNPQTCRERDPLWRQVRGR